MSLLTGNFLHVMRSWFFELNVAVMTRSRLMRGWLSVLETMANVEEHVIS